MSSAENVILVGLPGTGKSLAGQEAARLLGWEFVDMDSAIEKRAGKSIQRIFQEEGEPAFRLLERDALKAACTGSGRVISTGGGAIVYTENRELMLKRGVVVWLDASPETIYDRLTGRDATPLAERPLLAGPEPLERIKSLNDQRRVYYSQAHHVVDTDGLTVEQVARAVVKNLVLK